MCRYKLRINLDTNINVKKETVSSIDINMAVEKCRYRHRWIGMLPPHAPTFFYHYREITLLSYKKQTFLGRRRGDKHFPTVLGLTFQLSTSFRPKFPTSELPYFPTFNFPTFQHSTVPAAQLSNFPIAQLSSFPTSPNFPTVQLFWA